VFAGDFVYDLMGAPGKSHTTMKFSTQVATPDEIERIGQLLEKGLQQGSIGIGHAPGDVPLAADFGEGQRLLQHRLYHAA
jgi:hypothetical protein